MNVKEYDSITPFFSLRTKISLGKRLNPEILNSDVSIGVLVCDY